MAEGPEDLVAEAMVIPLFLFLAQKDPPEGVLRIFWRDPHPAIGIHDNPVRRTRSTGSSATTSPPAGRRQMTRSPSWTCIYG
jgi:hypothetical protein